MQRYKICPQLRLLFSHGNISFFALFAGKCDFTRFKKCTCMSPAVYTPDGRGNCNLGVTKPDKQVWCYVNESHGHPLKVCPDSRESSSRPGLYWSRFACITE